MRLIHRISRVFARKVAAHILVFSLFAAVSLACGEPDSGSLGIKHKQIDSGQINESDIVSAVLIKAYPETVKSCDSLEVVLKNGMRIPRHSRSDTSHYPTLSRNEYEELLNTAGVDEQILSGLNYSKSYFGAEVNVDPGRMRCESFFKAMYGQNSTEVKKNLTEVVWMPGISGRKILVTKVNSVNKKLISVSEELSRLPAKYHRYVSSLGGTYNWRVISGSQRLSAHSFGIAIDINTTYSNYWKWDQKSLGEFVYRNSIPMEIVDIFEKHGFIWGGRWYHYDTMHFEYRPEIAIYLNAKERSGY